MIFPRFFNNRCRFVWLGLVFLVLLFSGSMHAAVPNTIAVGKITAIDTVRQVFVIDGNRYTLAQNAMIYQETREGQRVMRATDLKIGQSVEFEFMDSLIFAIRVLE